MPHRERIEQAGLAAELVIRRETSLTKKHNGTSCRSSRQKQPHRNDHHGNDGRERQLERSWPEPTTEQTEQQASSS